jgi:hypothetical protein
MTHSAVKELGGRNGSIPMPADLTRISFPVQAGLAQSKEHSSAPNTELHYVSDRFLGAELDQLVKN